MRRNERCLNSTVDIKMQERSYASHINKLRNIKPSIITSRPSTPLRFYLPSEVYEKSREDTARQRKINQIKVKNSSLNSKEGNSSHFFLTNSSQFLTNNSNFDQEDSQFFLTQSNFYARKTPSKPPNKSNKSKIDIFLSKTPPNQWKKQESCTSQKRPMTTLSSSRIRNENQNVYIYSKHKIEEKQKKFSNKFNQKYLRTEISLQKQKSKSKKKDETNFSTESEISINMSESNLNSENSSFLNSEKVDNQAIVNLFEETKNEFKEKFCQKENEDGNTIKYEKCTKDNEILNSENEKSQETQYEKAGSEEHARENSNQKKHKKVIRKKVRKIRIKRINCLLANNDNIR